MRRRILIAAGVILVALVVLAVGPAADALHLMPLAQLKKAGPPPGESR